MVFTTQKIIVVVQHDHFVFMPFLYKPSFTYLEVKFEIFLKLYIILKNYDIFLKFYILNI